MSALAIGLVGSSLVVLGFVAIWIRTWRQWRRDQRADEQVRLEMLQRRGWRELQRRKLLDREMHR
jgi:hypothetical protein